MDCEKYEIRYSFEVFEMIDEIYKHIEKFTLSTQSAQKVVSEIILGMDKLEVFPERGFNVDDRVGKQLKPPYKTRGLVVGQYITFYQILEENVVFISHLISAKSDWIKYFGKH